MFTKKYDLRKKENKRQEEKIISIVPIENMLNEWVSSLHVNILISDHLHSFIKCATIKQISSRETLYEIITTVFESTIHLNNPRIQ